MHKEAKDPKVAVIIPTYNRARELQRCLDSVEIQSYRDFHVVVVDDGSTDDTEAVVRSFSGRIQIRYLKIENTGLPSKARNYGIRHTDSPILAFLDSDDWWHRRKLEASLESVPSGYFLAYHDSLFRPTRPIHLFRRRVRCKDVSGNPLAYLTKRGNQITTSTVVVSQELVSDLGGFNESIAFRGGEDYELWLRIAQSGCDFRKIRGAWTYYWAGGGNLSEPSNTYSLFLAFHEDFQSRGKAIPGWLNFGLGWSSFHLGDYQTARRNLIRAVRKGNSLRRYRDFLHALKLIFTCFKL